MKCGSGSSQFLSKQRRNKHSWRYIKRANSCSEVLVHVYCCLFRCKCFEEVTALSARPSETPANFGTVTKRPDLSVSKRFSLSFWGLLWPGLVTFRSGAKSWLLVFIKKYIHNAWIKWAFWELAQWQLSERHISVPVLEAMSVMTDKNGRMYSTLLTFHVVFMFWYCFQIIIILLDTEVTVKTIRPDFFRNKGGQNMTLISRLYLYPRW